MTRIALFNIITDVSLQPSNTTCQNSQFLVIIVTSYVEHVELRNAHRTTYPAEILSKANTTRVFLLAQIPDDEDLSITQSTINEESETFGDILQGTFDDTYRNLTLKHLMGLKWASTTCPNASYILKVDDDSVYILETIHVLLRSFNYTSTLLMGYINNFTVPIRDSDSKWRVTWKEYPNLEYPHFLSGWYYITTPQVAAALCDEAVYHRYFWIDDIFVTGMVRESLDVSLQPSNTTCQNSQFLVIIVTSYVEHVELRNAHRTTYPAETLSKSNTTRVFLLAQIPDDEDLNITQSAINEESETFGDILQGTFDDTYRNLTLKHLMGLKWASTTCPNASYILKVDDDSVYILGTTHDLLRSSNYTSTLLMGYINNHTVPIRDSDNKWRVTWKEYPSLKYPHFLSGWYYITTPRVAAALCDEAVYHRYFWIDDIFVTGMVRESLGINLTELPNEFGPYIYMDCVYVIEQNYFDCKA
ncbi:hypothetical protein PYW08_007605 [Mythimna loreyi]|uniref:Uncharacterized protein n=1 Tax=Mythimna loreyi TaxID=667449 RepID=A0ACC2QDB5_9NEOP|nr:hypothetical protein PYW08_007605 [Mythimna loreyi]